MTDQQQIQELTLEEVMGDRFGRYSKYIIQERALPDIRDGLKPVQRRILYSMHKDGNTYEKAFRKSAKSVGNIMGNYHPHGDSSIYDAMVRMSQEWKLREVLIEMHGNNGSMDGDPPAAMRYTEARLSQLSGELLKDIEKETVDFVWNFDDTEKEPVVLPAQYPNLLVNGSTGISAGYATEIPSHNLAEVIDGTIYLIDHPNATVDKLMEFIPGPDFPTGGILQGKEEIRRAYQTGKGRVILRSKTKIETIKGGRQQIVINEIPYEVNKANLVKKMDEVRLNKKIDGISEVRDESDRNGLQIVVELKKEANAEGILNYLFKHTDLQVNYNFNMVAIDHMHPKQVGLKRILESYIAHRRQVVLQRTQFDLEKAQKRQHIVEGLMKALSILDEVIATIRGSKDKKNAKEQLVIQHQFTEEQSEAIVMLQLYRLTNTDITQLRSEAKELAEQVTHLTKVISEEAELLRVIKKELRDIKKKYGHARLTEIEDKIEEIIIETEVLVIPEEVIVAVTKEGYLKRSSLRSYQASKPEEIGMKDSDQLLYLKQLNTLDHLLLVTNQGNVIYRPVHEITELRYKELGEHLSQTIASYLPEEEIMAVFDYKEIDPHKQLVLVSREGWIKQTKLSEFAPWRTYKSRSQTAMTFKTTTDVLVHVQLVDQNETDLDIFLTTHACYGLRYGLAEVPVVGPKAAGVKAINLKEQDFIVQALVVYSQGDTPIIIVTQRGAIKRMLAQEIAQTSRGKRGQMVLRELKNNPHRIIFMDNGQDGEFLLQNEKGEQVTINAQSFPIADRTSNGSFVMDEKVGGKVFQVRKIKQVEIENS